MFLSRKIALSSTSTSFQSSGTLIWGRACIRTKSKWTFPIKGITGPLLTKATPYMQLARMDKPIGTWLLYIPCTWSILMASNHAQHISSTTISHADTCWMLGLFGLGAFAMRGAGCTINDMWDQNFDRKVERTRDRPLAAKKLSMLQATTFLGAQLSCGLAVLTQLNYNSIILGLASLPLVVAYPLAKRFTNWPQVVLGFTFNWGALLGWVALLGENNLAITLPLYLGGVSWTLFYDTIYAHQDKEDDEKIGVRSTALTLGDNTKTWLNGFAVTTFALVSLAGYLNHQSIPFFIGTGSSFIYMLYLARCVNINDPASCGKMFRKSQTSGWLITAGLLGDLIVSNHLPMLSI